MLSKLRVQHYKSLFDTEVDLEPLTVFIGPNGSGKSNICEALFVLSDFLEKLIKNTIPQNAIHLFTQSLIKANNNQQEIKSKFWQGKQDYLLFEVSTLPTTDNTNFISDILLRLDYPQQIFEFLPIYSIKSDKVASHTFTSQLTDKSRNILVSNQYSDSPLANALKKVSIYDFAPISLSSNIPSSHGMDKTGQGIVDALADILLNNRKSFDELEERLTRLVPNIQRISLHRREDRTFVMELIDRYSEHHIPASDISDGTLRILAFLTALYQDNTPSIICFEEIENGVHPWLLHKMMELLKIISTDGITGKPVQVLITTHSPLLLNYVEPHQVRAVELDNEGKTQIHALPVDSERFQKALEAYDGALGELWFSNIFGGNPV
ncbi:AAA family ATPase [Brunnivagina elsteri]|uniref:Chromosome segregation protein SMC n=1 Tax=Brunnivagina elsteri CCALA 953 TaxID=987040 RepID=A0A2A2TMI9_9CYAN|nr:ATP-binding protein [Calothrix elsteri]PAX59731.1 chromosome segregation protein SMC [Calothrix elsteri CCALA 953]